MSKTALRGDCSYYYAWHCIGEIQKAMQKFGIQDTINNLNEPSDEFIDKFEEYFYSLEIEQQKYFFEMLGIAKGLADIAEKAGYDCL